MATPDATVLPSALQMALVFHDAIATSYTPRSALGQAVAYLVRKQPALTFSGAEQALRAALSARPIFPT